MISLLALLNIYDQGFISQRNRMFGNNPIQKIYPKMKNIVVKDDGTCPPNVAIQPDFSFPNEVYSTFLLARNKTKCLIGKEIFETCTNNPSHEKCKILPEYVILDKNTYFFCTDLDNIYNDIKKIPSKTTVINIESSINLTDFDVGKLNRKNIGFSFIANDPFDFILDEDYENLWNYQFVLGIRSSSKEKIKLNIRIQQVRPLMLTILGSPLNTESFMTFNTRFTPDSEVINIDRFEAYISEIRESNFMDKLKTKHLSIISNSKYNDGCEPQFRISYKQDQIDFFSKPVLDEDFKSEPVFSIKYDDYEKIDLITTTDYIELYVDNKDITKTKDINITIFDYFYINSDRIHGTKHKITLATTGDWSGIKDKAKVIFTSFQDYISLDNKCNSKVEIEKVEANVLPIAPSDESIRENQKLQLEIGENDSPNEIKQKIENTFSNGKNKKIDYYIEIDSSITLPEDLDLDENQFIKFKDVYEVELKKGRLNILIIDEYGISINVDDPKNATLSIKNQAQSTITINTIKKDETKQDITIKANSEIYNQLTLKIGANVRSIKFDSINFHKSGNIIVNKDEDSDAFLTVGSLTVHPQTTGKLNDVEIDEKLNVSQASSLELKNVKLEKSDLVINLVSYNYDNYQTALLKGNLGAGPKSITLTNIKDESPVKDTEYLLFEGTFEKGCDNWANSINLKGNQFNKKICKSFEDQRLQEFHGSLFVKKGKNKLSAGQIAGIVIGCVAFVAIVVIVVVLVKKRKKDRLLSNDDSSQGIGELDE